MAHIVERLLPVVPLLLGLPIHMVCIDPPPLVRPISLAVDQQRIESIDGLTRVVDRRRTAPCHSSQPSPVQPSSELCHVLVEVHLPDVGDEATAIDQHSLGELGEIVKLVEEWSVLGNVGKNQINGVRCQPCHGFQLLETAVEEPETVV